MIMIFLIRDFCVAVAVVVIRPGLQNT